MTTGLLYYQQEANRSPEPMAEAGFPMISLMFTGFGTLILTEGALSVGIPLLSLGVLGIIGMLTWIGYSYNKSQGEHEKYKAELENIRLPDQKTELAKDLFIARLNEVANPEPQASPLAVVAEVAVASTQANATQQRQ
jgi:hypothetical protein